MADLTRPPPAIEVQGLGMRYDGKAVLQDIGFKVTPGEVVVLLGPSGAGKTTLFRCLTRLVEAESGEIRVLGRAIRGLKPRALRRARRDVGLVFQQHNLIRRRSALDNVLAGRLAEVALWRVASRRFGAAERQRAYAALDRVGLLDIAHRRADRLSGGQQQRVAIARVLAQESRVILADEPVASLDPSSAVAILSLLRDVARQDGIAVLCSLHQVDLVQGFADRVIGLRGGRLVADNPVEAFRLTRDSDLYAAPDAR
jgi:phosphonate transport system ATP-binding protein